MSRVIRVMSSSHICRGAFFILKSASGSCSEQLPVRTGRDEKAPPENNLFAWPLYFLIRSPDRFFIMAAQERS